MSVRACVCVRCALSSNKSFAAQLRWPNALSPARASALLPNRSPSVPRPLLLPRLILLPLLGRRASCPGRVCVCVACVCELAAGGEVAGKTTTSSTPINKPVTPVTHPVTSPTAGGALSHSGAARRAPHRRRRLGSCARMGGTRRGGRRRAGRGKRGAGAEGETQVRKRHGSGSQISHPIVSNCRPQISDRTRPPSSKALLVL